MGFERNSYGVTHYGTTGKTSLAVSVALLRRSIEGGVTVLLHEHSP